MHIFGRRHFIERRFAYQPGHSATFIGPNGFGKTHLAYELLAQVANPKHPAICLVKKPKDDLITAVGKELGYRLVHEWPPPLSIWKPRRPPGYLVWPKTTFTLADRAHKSAVFESALIDSYKRGNRIIYVDDAYGIAHILQLKEVMTELWTEIRSMKGGLWAAFQRPVFVPPWAYSEAEHLFLFKSTDKRARERYAEIGSGIDPDMIKDVVIRLEKFQCLYIRRTGPKMCVIDRD